MTHTQEQVIALCQELEEQSQDLTRCCSSVLAAELIWTARAERDEARVARAAELINADMRASTAERERNAALTRVKEVGSRDEWQLTSDAYIQRDAALARADKAENRIMELAESRAEILAQRNECDRHMRRLERENVKLIEALKISGVWDKPMGRAAENERLRVAWDEICINGWIVKNENAAIDLLYASIGGRK